MLTLKHLNVQNFRLINKIDIELDENKITGIIGENGSGKSSLLIGLKWALFGATPDNVKQGDLRRQGIDLSKDPTFVEVTLKHEGQEVKVRREMKGKQNSTTVYIWVDDVLQTKTSVGVSEAWIRKRFGFGVDMFSTSFVIGQKELDNLIKVKPTPRRALIEKLTGVEKLSKALESARSDLSSSKKALAGHDITQQKIDDISEVVETAIQTLKEAEEEQNSFSSDMEELEQAYNKATASLEEALKLFEIKASKEKELSARQESVENSAKTLEDIKELVESHVKQYGDKEPSDMSDVENKYLTAKNKEKENSRTVLELENSIKSLKENRKTSEELKLQKEKEIPEKLKTIDKASGEKNEEENILNTLETELEKEHQKKQELFELLSSLKANLGSTEEILEAVSKKEGHEHSDNSLCPTCGQEIEDLEKIVKQLESKKNTEEVLVENTKKDSLKQDELIKEIKEKIEMKVALIKKIETTLETHSQINDLEKEIEKISKNLKTLDDDLLKAQEETSKHHKKFVDIEKIYHNAENMQQSYTTFISLSEKLSDAEETYKNAKKNVKSLKEEISNIQAPTIEEGRALRSKQEAAKEAYLDTKEKFDNYKEKYNEAKIIAAENKVRLENAQEAYSKKEAAIAYVSHITSAVELISSYRKDYLAKLAPELAAEATVLISHMTQGRYIEIMLDENFTPSVMDYEGNIRPAAWLSGGEESCVALALRMAVGSIVSQGTGGLLWLDEVLTAQDEGRRAAMLTTLREHGRGRQVIIINHSPEAVDNVDEILEIMPTNNGSFIQERQLSDFSDFNLAN